MGSHYCQLTEQNRIYLNALLDEGYSKFYAPQLAQQKSLCRRQRPLKLIKEKDLCAYVHSKLLKGWSPWQIEGRLKLKNDGKCIISHETIYRYIYSNNKLRNRLYKK